ncbi:MAG: hypothetical protein WDN69_29500 [Aliidongia sp.]
MLPDGAATPRPGLGDWAPTTSSGYCSVAGSAPLGPSPKCPAAAVGLDVVREAMTRLGGTVAVRTQAGRGTAFRAGCSVIADLD